MITAGRATMHELDTVYGVQDLYQLAEIVAVDSYNAALAAAET